MWNNDCVIISELRKTDKLYSEKQKSNLAWKLKELTDLNEEGRELCAVASFRFLQSMDCDIVQDNIPRQVTTMCQKVYPFIRRVTRHKHTHILVFMISPEERSAIPIQCIPYKSPKARELANKIICEMVKVTGKRFAHATGPLVNNVKLRTI